MLKEIDVIGKKVEIYKVKLLLFMAVASGSWVYALICVFDFDYWDIFKHDQT